MPVHPRPRVRTVAHLVLVAVLAAACSTGAAGSTPVPGGAGPERPAVDPAVDPASDRGGAPPAGAAAGSPYEVLLTGDLRGLAAGHPGAGDAVVELRVVVAGDRSRVTTRVGGQVVDEHVVSDDGHWLWIPPALREGLDAEWVHLDVAALEDAGLPLPGHVAQARGPVPTPGDVAVGDVVGGMEVLDVEDLPGDAVRLTLADLPVPMTLRRRPLPGGTQVELPVGALDARDVPELLGT